MAYVLSFYDGVGWLSETFHMAFMGFGGFRCKNKNTVHIFSRFFFIANLTIYEEKSSLMYKYCSLARAQPATKLVFFHFKVD